VFESVASVWKGAKCNRPCKLKCFVCINADVITGDIQGRSKIY